MEGLCCRSAFTPISSARGRSANRRLTLAFTTSYRWSRYGGDRAVRFAARVLEEASRPMNGSVATGVIEALVYARDGARDPSLGRYLRYLLLSLQIRARQTIAWRAAFDLGAEPPRILIGDLVQARSTPGYGGQEARCRCRRARSCDDVVRKLEDVATRVLRGGLAAVRPGVTFASWWHAMESRWPRPASGADTALHT